MKLVVGLGNPGPKYEGTRHNIGFNLLFNLAERSPGTIWKSRFEGQLTEVSLGNERVLLLAPHTFMNLSGRSVKAAVQFYKIFPEEVLVMCDDLNLPLGKQRLKAAGTAGGQKGLQNIIDQLGTLDVPRLRLGIGRPPETVDPANYVLQRFHKSELETVEVVLSTATSTVDCWATQGITVAMNRFNGSSQ